MSNVEVIRDGYDAWNRRDFGAVLANLHENVEWRFDADAAVVPEADPIYYGHEGVRRFWELWVEPWESMTIKPEELIENGDLVVVFVRFQAVGRGSGVPVETQPTHVYEMDAGKTKRFAHYADREKALRDAGLDPDRAR
ncbi:MAG TPA: nuclear transport factor 2 family protein [Solirubrobacteraceae bacterium]|nr:nuclear transport factor 2 family protein [Solirubrobacteraceae bacterium]